jgi:hypothetical protein
VKTKGLRWPLGSTSEFSHWLSMSNTVGTWSLLRMLVDMLFGTKDTGSSTGLIPCQVVEVLAGGCPPPSRSWGLDRKKLEPLLFQK